MMSLLVAIIFIVLFTAADYARGDDDVTWKGKSLAAVTKAGYGFIVSCAIAYYAGGSSLLFVLVYTLLFALGSAPGWGHPIGIALGGPKHDKYERWQVNDLLKTDIRAALVARAAIWHFPTLLSIAVGPWLVLPVALVQMGSFVAAPYIAKHLRERIGFDGIKYNFDVTNATRGFISGVGVVVVGLILG